MTPTMAAQGAGSPAALPASGAAGESLGWLPLLSGLTIGAASLSIGAALLVLLRRRRDLAASWPFGILATFAGLVGVTQLVQAWAVVRPGLALAGTTVAGIAAAMSLALAAMLWPALPRLLSLRCPAALAREVPAALAREMEECRAAERRAREGERRARESEARTAAVLDNLAEAVFVVRVVPGGAGEGPFGLRLETVNTAFERMFGIGCAEVAGRPAETALPEPLLTLALPRWHEAAVSGEMLEYELTGDLPGGRMSWQTVLVPLRGPDGRVERLIGSARNVTDTRRLQAGLVQSARLATVGTLCAGLAHEASQPLNAAALWLRRARAALQGLGPDQHARALRAVSVVEDQLRRAGQLVGHIRALAGDEPREAAVFDAAEPVAAALRVASTQYAAEGIAISLRVEGEGLAVRGSPVRLEQALLQLLSNARDALQERRRADPSAPGRIDVLLRRERSLVAIELRDSGTGIPEALRDAIFDPFFTTKEPGRGTGLGLSFAAGVARAMGGGMEAWNLPGSGACFRMELGSAELRPVPRPVPARMAEPVPHASAAA